MGRTKMRVNKRLPPEADLLLENSIFPYTPSLREKILLDQII
jgi:hypothetical protein